MDGFFVWLLTRVRGKRRVNSGGDGKKLDQLWGRFGVGCWGGRSSGFVVSVGVLLPGVLSGRLGRGLSGSTEQWESMMLIEHKSSDLLQNSARLLNGGTTQKKKRSQPFVFILLKT